MRETVSRTLWRHLDAVRRKLSAVSRPRRGVSSADPRGLRTDGGDREDRDQLRRRDEAAHLRDVPDGAGCTEIWEHLSERGAAEAKAEADD